MALIVDSHSFGIGSHLPSKAEDTLGKERARNLLPNLFDREVVDLKGGGGIAISLESGKAEAALDEVLAIESVLRKDRKLVPVTFALEGRDFYKKVMREGIPVDKWTRVGSYERECRCHFEDDGIES